MNQPRCPPTPPGDRKAIQDSAFMLSLGYTLWKQVELILNHPRKDHTRWIPVMPLRLFPKQTHKPGRKGKEDNLAVDSSGRLCCRFHAWHRESCFIPPALFGRDHPVHCDRLPVGTRRPFCDLGSIIHFGQKLSWLCWQELSLLTPFNARRTGNKVSDVTT